MYLVCGFVLCAFLLFFLTFWCHFLQVPSSINRCLFWCQLTTELLNAYNLKILLKFDIVTPVTVALMHRTVKYLISFTPKCFALDVAAVSAKLRAILLYNMCKILQFLCRFVNSVHDGQFYRRLPILHAQNRRILTFLAYHQGRNQKFISWGGCFFHVPFRPFLFPLPSLFPSSLPFLSFPAPRSGPSNPAKGFGGALLAASVGENDICSHQTRSLTLKTGNVSIVAANVALPAGES